MDSADINIMVEDSSETWDEMMKDNDSLFGDDECDEAFSGDAPETTLENGTSSGDATETTLENGSSLARNGKNPPSVISTTVSLVGDDEDDGPLSANDKADSLFAKDNGSRFGNDKDSGSPHTAPAPTAAPAGPVSSWIKFPAAPKIKSTAPAGAYASRATPDTDPAAPAPAPAPASTAQAAVTKDGFVLVRDIPGFQHSKSATNNGCLLRSTIEAIEAEGKGDIADRLVPSLTLPKQTQFPALSAGLEIDDRTTRKQKLRPAIMEWLAASPEHMCLLNRTPGTVGCYENKIRLLRATVDMLRGSKLGVEWFGDASRTLVWPKDSTVLCYHFVRLLSHTLDVYHQGKKDKIRKNSQSMPPAPSAAPVPAQTPPAPAPMAASDARGSHAPAPIAAPDARVAPADATSTEPAPAPTAASDAQGATADDPIDVELEASGPSRTVSPEDLTPESPQRGTTAENPIDVDAPTPAAAPTPAPAPNKRKRTLPNWADTPMGRLVNRGFGLWER